MNGTPPNPGWSDWTTSGQFRVRLSAEARDQVGRLPPTVQLRLRMRLHQLAELAHLEPMSTDQHWRTTSQPLLRLSAEGATLLYTISEEHRTIDVVALQSADDQFGDVG